MARKSLKQLINNYENVELTEIDVVTEFKTASSDGIRLFPAIRIGERQLAGLLLSSNKIELFLNQNLQRTQ